MVGARARQDLAAARVPALKSEWSLPRGEGDRVSFSVGRGPQRARGRGSPVTTALSGVGLAGVTAADLALGHDQVRRAHGGGAGSREPRQVRPAPKGAAERTLGSLGCRVPAQLPA